MVHAVKIKDGKVTYSSHWVQTAKLLQVCSEAGHTRSLPACTCRDTLVASGVGSSVGGGISESWNPRRPANVYRRRSWAGRRTRRSETWRACRGCSS